MRRILPLLMTAFWTGRSYPTTTASGLVGIACEYRAVETVWRVFRGSYCPHSIEVE